MTAKISVVIPAYNAAAFIEGAVNSVLAQSLLPEKIIIVDDGSTDETERVVQRLVCERRGQPPCLQYVRQDNQGPSAARNRGIQCAAGEYIAFLDADDRWLPSKLKAQMDVFQTRPEAGLVCTGRFRVEETTGRRLADCVGRTLSHDGYRDLWTRGNYVVTSSAVVRRHCFEELDGFDEDPRALCSEDVDMWLRVAAQFPVVYINEPLVEYLVRAGGINRSNIRRAYESAAFVLRKHEGEFRWRYPDADTVIQRKWGRHYHHWGLTLFDLEQFADAKQKFQAALKFRRFDVQTLRFYLLTMLGPELLASLKHWKRKVMD